MAIRRASARAEPALSPPTSAVRRRALRNGARPQAKQSTAQPAPLSLTPPGISATAGLPGSTAAGSGPITDDRPAEPQRRNPPSAGACAAAAAQSAGAHSRRHAGRRCRRHRQHRADDDRASATLLRRRTAAEEDAFAQLGLRAGAFIVSPARRSDRRLRHQSGAHAGRARRRRSSPSRPNCSRSRTGSATRSPRAARQLHGLRPDAGARPARAPTARSPGGST